MLETYSTSSRRIAFHYLFMKNFTDVNIMTTNNPASSFSKAFEAIPNKSFLKHLISFSLLSDRQYSFREERSTGNLFVFPTDPGSPSLTRKRLRDK